MFKMWYFCVNVKMKNRQYSEPAVKGLNIVTHGNPVNGIFLQTLDVGSMFVNVGVPPATLAQH